MTTQFLFWQQNLYSELAFVVTTLFMLAENHFASNKDDRERTKFDISQFDQAHSNSSSSKANKSNRLAHVC